MDRSMSHRDIPSSVVRSGGSCIPEGAFATTLLLAVSAATAALEPKADQCGPYCPGRLCCVCQNNCQVSQETTRLVGEEDCKGGTPWREVRGGKRRSLKGLSFNEQLRSSDWLAMATGAGTFKVAAASLVCHVDH
ncbi:unnamed protein product [Zymoseptoria tritici ST99CH_1E4]|uniref:Uncharacterized protein n=1 Tax=Zymoseptoria tritici ST99CH_1E4 TaxID=1276532 RepID=A0A2H1GZK8_ZYMTR|nr:unnamed protein product [Zymoseptoria tritici ST99CH_1E4]